MKIHVFTVIEESYRHGELNKETKRFLKTEELRDGYFDHLMNFYRNSLQLIDDGNGDFNDNYNWSYHIEKGEEDLEIIEEETW